MDIIPIALIVCLHYWYDNHSSTSAMNVWMQALPLYAITKLYTFELVSNEAFLKSACAYHVKLNKRFYNFFSINKL